MRESASVNLRDMVRRPDTVAGRRFERSILVLIVASLVSMSLSTVSGLPPAWRTALAGAEYAIMALFTAEYVVRIVHAERRWAYVRSFYGIIDLVALLTFYLALGWGAVLDLRAVRALRLLRVFRAFEFARYTAAATRIGRALAYARDEAMVFLFATLVLVYIAAMGIYHFESQAQPEKFDSVFHSLWWSVVTLTTVGYGDAYPVTLGGRIWTFVVLLLAMGIVAVPAGLIATGLSRAIEEERAAKSRSGEGGGGVAGSK